jgi:hypothetical protein
VGAALDTDTQWVLAALADLSPARCAPRAFAVPDDPVYAVTPRNFVVSFVATPSTSGCCRQTDAGTQPTSRVPEGRATAA